MHTTSGCQHLPLTDPLKNPMMKSSGFGMSVSAPDGPEENIGGPWKSLGECFVCWHFDWHWSSSFGCPVMLVTNSQTTQCQKTLKTTNSHISRNFICSGYWMTLSESRAFQWMASSESVMIVGRIFQWNVQWLHLWETLTTWQPLVGVINVSPKTGKNLYNCATSAGWQIGQSRV